MGKAAVAVANDGGAVVATFLMVAAIAYAMFTAVSFYTYSTAAIIKERKEKRLVRLLSGWANIGNSVIHALLVVYMKANEANTSDYWEKERALGGIEGPVGLMVINFSVGILALTAGWLRLSVGWNSFVALAGTAIPIVWPRFLDEGLTTWPLIIVFIWFAIFAFELTAFTSSATWLALKGLSGKDA